MSSLTSRRVLGALSVAFVASALVLAGCGTDGAPTSTASGFTDEQQTSLANAIDLLGQTTIPSTLGTLAANAVAGPAACRIHARAGREGSFTLFAYWKPRIDTENAKTPFYTWLTAVIGAPAQNDSYDISYSNARVSSAELFRLLEQHLPRDFYEQPLVRCTISREGALSTLTSRDPVSP